MYHCGTRTVLTSLSDFLPPQSQCCIELVFLKATSDLHLGRVSVCFSVFISFDLSAAIVFVFSWYSFQVFSNALWSVSRVWSRDLFCVHFIHYIQVISAGTKLSLVPGCKWPPDLGLLSTFHYSPWPLPASCLPPSSDHSLLRFFFLNFIFLIILFFISTCLVKFLHIPKCKLYSLVHFSATDSAWLEEALKKYTMKAASSLNISLFVIVGTSLLIWEALVGGLINRIGALWFVSTHF